MSDELNFIIFSENQVLHFGRQYKDVFKRLVAVNYFCKILRVRCLTGF